MDNYAQLKASGALVITSATPQLLTYEVKQFDPNTGQPLDPAIYSVDIDSVNNQIAVLQPQLANWQAMLKDFPSTALSP